MAEQETRLTRDIAEAAKALREGQPVAVPTETVYGLAADATSAAAVVRLYAAKQRPAFNPLIAHVASASEAWRHIRPCPAHKKLAEAFWPGPLTLLGDIQPDSPIVPLARAGLPRQAVRVPAHPVMQALLAACGLPLVAPSANASGRLSPTRADHVLDSLAGRIPLILDGGPCSVGVESTVIGFEGETPVLLRPGAITAEALAEALGRQPCVPTDSSIQSPGQLASHYAPRKPLMLNITHAPADCFMIGFGAVAGDASLSAQADLMEAAARLFELLHVADASTAARIAVAPIPRQGLGIAINDRLSRAAAR